MSGKECAARKGRGGLPVPRLGKPYGSRLAILLTRLACRRAGRSPRGNLSVDRNLSKASSYFLTFVNQSKKGAETSSS